MQYDLPAASAGLKRAIDSIGCGCHGIQGNRQIVVIRPLADGLAVEVAVLGDLTSHHCGTLEWVEGEPVLPYCHEAFTYRPARSLHWRNLSDPASL